MKRLILLLLISLVASAYPAFGQGYRHEEKLLDAVTAATTSHASDLQGVIPYRHTVQVITTGSPTTCTIALQGSLDNTTWFSLSGDQSCTSSVMFHVADKPSRWIRANLSALTGGASPTVTAKYLGTR